MPRQTSVRLRHTYIIDSAVVSSIAEKRRAKVVPNVNRREIFILKERPQFGAVEICYIWLVRAYRR